MARLGRTKLGEDAEGGFRMQKRDQLAARAVNGFLVNQLHSRRRRLLELRFDLVGAEGQVVDAAVRILFQKLGDGAIRGGGPRAIPGGLHPG